MNGGSTATEYADHEVQIVSGRVTVDTDFFDGTTADYIHSTEPVSKRGLDSNELAELKAMYRTCSIRIGALDDNLQTELGDATAEVALGVNMGPDELPTRTTIVGTDVTDSSATTVINDQNGGSFSVANFEEPGILDVTRATGAAGYEAATSGAGAGSQATTATERDFDFSVLGSGPYLDRTDDLDLAMELETVNLSDGVVCQVEVTYILYWDVHEAQGGRGAFARP